MTDNQRVPQDEPFGSFFSQCMKSSLHSEYLWCHTLTSVLGITLVSLNPLGSGLDYVLTKMTVIHYGLGVKQGYWIGVTRADVTFVELVFH